MSGFTLLARPWVIVLIFLLEQLTFLLGGTALAVAASKHL